MAITNRPYVRHTPDDPASILCYSSRMPSTPEQRQRRRERARKRKAERPKGVCSRFPNCTRKAVPGFKLCSVDQERRKEAKRRLKDTPRPEGECRVLECRRPARAGLTRCGRCAEKEAAYARRAPAKMRRAVRRQEVRQEVLEAYGAVCLCCGETHLRFLTIDHIDRFDGTTPRSGDQLYLWLIRNGFPKGFRVLCQNCNSALGKFGYCPHGSLTQPLKQRPVLDRTKQNRAAHQKRNLRDKRQAFSRYGGVCVCCSEPNQECLTIDHINDDGAEHRRELKGTPIYRWLRHNNYPPGFQVLCWNCNTAKKFGPCPHGGSHGD